MSNYNKQIKNLKSPSNNPLSTNIIKSVSARRHKQNKNFVFQQNSIDIDPWHVNSNKKYISVNKLTKFSDKSTNLKLCPDSLRKYTKNSSFQTLNYQALKNPFNSIINEDGVLSPTKIDMLECSFRFEQYEKQKARQIKSKFANQNQKDFLKDQKQNQITQGTKNFIEKNIKNAFFIQNQIPMFKKITKTDKKKTICEQAKQKLLLNNEKLERSSKQLQNFISMKQSSPKLKNQIQNPPKYIYKIPIESKWNFSYVEKQLNPQHQSTRFKKVLLKNRGKSSQVKKRLWKKSDQSLTKNDNKNQNSLSRKLSRLFKVKNRSILVIQNDLHQNQKRIKNRSQSKESRRIHSLTPNKTIQKVPTPQVFQFHKNIQSYMSINEVQNQLKPKSRHNQRSFSANLIKRTSNHSNEYRNIQRQTKIKPNQKIKEYLVTNNLYLQGKEFQLVNLCY